MCKLSFYISIKILSVLLARRLRKLIPLIIHPSQSGFIKNRQTSDNIFFENWYFDNVGDNLELAVLISLGTEKVFDMVQTEFMKSVLRRYRLPSSIELPFGIYTLYGDNVMWR